MKRKSWLFKFIVTAVLLTGVAIAFANAPKWISALRNESEQSEKAEKDDKIVYSAAQEEAFRKLVNVYQQIDSSKELFLAGTMDGFNPADSADILHTNFRFCRKSNELYYQTEQVEMVALKGMYLAISNDSKKIFLNAPREIISPFKLSSDSLLAIFKSESYQMITAEDESKMTLRFICPNHVYCKEYRFVIAENRLKEFSVRLTNLDDPLNDAKDTRVKVAINQWQEKNVPVNLLKAETYVKLKDGTYEPSGSYTNYELIDYSTVNPD